MNIVDCGDIIMCRNITFEDNKYDLEGGHPGVALLPASDKQDMAYFIYMTSDGERAKKEKDNYVFLPKSGMIKDSYVNLSLILKKPNTFHDTIARMKNNDFYFILNEFYNYQNSLKPKKKEFLEIKERVEVLLGILKINMDYCFPEVRISEEELEALRDLKDPKKIKKIYLTSAIISKTKNEKKLGDFYDDSFDMEYYKKLGKVCEFLSLIGFKRIDLNDSNNEMRQAFLNFEEKCDSNKAQETFREIYAISRLTNDGLADKLIELNKLEMKRRNRLFSRDSLGDK